jgi:putative membrane protein
MFAAPLIAAGVKGLDAPAAAIAIAGFLRRTPMLAASTFGLLLWFWHAPAPYAATFGSYLTYWLMHITLIAAAIWLWSALIETSPENSLTVLLAGVVSTVQMGFLGALITFVPRALYSPHFLTTRAWGLTPLQDQQLGGVVMWVPGCIIFLLAASAVLWRVIGQAGHGAIAPTALHPSRKVESPVLP